MNKLFFLFILISSVLIAQSFEYSESIGKFNKTSSFYITANGLIYVADSGRDEVVLIDTLGNQLRTFGGYGWDENSFDEPADVFADPLTIYVADKNNQLFIPTASILHQATRSAAPSGVEPELF